MLVWLEQQADRSCRHCDAGLNRKKKEKHQSHRFKEGWVEFEDKRVARSVAEMLNAQPIGASLPCTLTRSRTLRSLAAQAESASGKTMSGR